MLDILPGLETSAVFQPDMEGLIHRLFSWAEKSSEPLQSYATGLLAAAMEVQDIATCFRDQNAKMVPLMLKRLHQLQQEAAEERKHIYPVKRKVKDKKKANGVIKDKNTPSNEEDKEKNSSEDDSIFPASKRIKGDSESNCNSNSNSINHSPLKVKITGIYS